MVKYLNNINKHVKLTLETQIGNKFNFLDLTEIVINNTFELSM